MKPESAAAAYKQAAFESAPPLKIVHMMYEGALRFLEQAQGMDPQSEAKAFDERLRRADAVISELRISLNHELAPELCRDLTALYFFAEDRIHQALTKRDADAVGPARDVLESLLGGWKAVEVEE